MIIFRLRVIEAEAVAGWACYAAGVVLQHVLQVFLVFGISDARGIGVRHIGVEGQGRDGVAVRGVKIHVLGEAIGIEEIIACPAVRNVRQMSGVKIHGYFIAGAEDHVLVVCLAHQVGDVAEARVISDLARVGAGGAHVLVDVGKIVLRIAFDHTRIAAELQLGFCERNFGELEFRIFRRIIHADAIPIDAQIGGDANEARAWAEFFR